MLSFQGCWPATYRLEKPKLRKRSNIDKNHSHFILVDNGTQHQYATEIPFRARLERAISLMKTGLEEGMFIYNQLFVSILLLDVWS